MSRPTPSGAGLQAAATHASSTEPSALRRQPRAPGGLGLPAPLLAAPLSQFGAPPEPALSERLPAVLAVAEDAAVCNAVARELGRDFELLNATTFASAVRQLSARPSLEAILVDLDLSDVRGAPWFLARLVDHAYEGPRILLSSALERERACSLRRSSLSHFTLARPWSPGELRSVLDATLGFYGLSWPPSL